MNIQEEVEAIGKVVKTFERNVKNYVIGSIDAAIQKNPTMSITIEKDHIIISDYIDGEQVDYLVYIDDHVTNIEATKQGFSIGYLEHDNETYIKYKEIIKPIEDVYRTYFSWDGQEFVTNLK